MNPVLRHLLSRKRPPVVFDGFNRADNATSLGATDTGQPWVVPVGTWGISGNQAHAAVLSGGNAYAHIDSGLSDNIKISVVIVNPSVALFRSTFRYSNTSNRFSVSRDGSPATYRLYRVESGTATEIANTGKVLVNNDLLEIVLTGSRIQFFINGEFYVSVSDTFNTDKTLHGISVTNVATRWDDFRVEVL